MSLSDKGLLGELQSWYLAQCNGSWEHTYGITIETVDNPGWYFKVDIADTYLADRIFEGISENELDDKNALICSVRDNVFTGSCPPNRLHEVISIFLRWANSPSTSSETRVSS